MSSRNRTYASDSCSVLNKLTIYRMKKCTQSIRRTPKHSIGIREEYFWEFSLADCFFFDSFVSTLSQNNTKNTHQVKTDSI